MAVHLYPWAPSLIPYPLPNVGTKVEKEKAAKMIRDKEIVFLLGPFVNHVAR